ncbi:29809_t:CDS:2 [Gigaspora margarita]|uniref:29809_t:CDS:1 n=1 Tax=Gigaspora margarita TaxID=4874 RepID=A0ABN7VZE4_GIGMA|nr:29809_t:CDS:2 [Gigaspora margarita]
MATHLPELIKYESNYDLVLVVLRKQKESKSATIPLGQSSKVDKKSNRTKWCLDQASKENWEDYHLRVRILKELCKEEMSEEVMMQYSKIDELNRIWEVIEDTIIKVGKKALPSKDIKNKLEKQNPRPKECRDLKAIKLLSIIISTIRKNQNSRLVADWRK